MIIGSMASALNDAGIHAEVRNDILGGATGEIAPGETWVELWVQDADEPAAVKQIEAIQTQTVRDDWLCNTCQEKNPATFEVCWQCG